MKKVLFATTALVLSAGVAAADVAVSGDGRMGLLRDFGATDTSFTSRLRISFTASGQSDGGLSFGGSIRADNAAAGAAGTGGSVFISGDFGRVTMGDTNGAAEAAVGDVRGVGLTGLGDLNDATYLSNPAAMRPTARYDYTIAGFGVHLSVSNPTATLTNPLATAPAIAFRNTVSSIAFTYNMDGLKLGLGYETTGNLNHAILGGSYTIAGITLAANYGELTGAGAKLTQTSASAAYTADALTVSAFYSDNRIRNAVTSTLAPTNVVAVVAGAPAVRTTANAFPSTIAYGLGGQYNLGGGASLRGGWVQNVTRRQSAVDFGVNFAF
jgi:outer membrane protein OmpU